MCKDGCGKSNISLDLVDRLQRLRTLLGRPIEINSGCRCMAHNIAVGGVSDSAHVCDNGKDGEAADIKITDPILLWAMVNIIFTYNLFDRIGVGKSLLHVDVSKSLPHPRIWVYGDK